MKYLLRYGEVGIKSGPVRRRMVDKLLQHARLLFAEAGAEATFRWEGGRLLAETEAPEAPDLLRRVFGLVSFSPVVETGAILPEVVDLLGELAREPAEPGSSFAVRVRRAGDHPFTSLDVAREAGSAILAAHPDLTVDLDRPDWEVFAEVRQEVAYGYRRVVPGAGGLPLGSEGTVAAWVDDDTGAMAAWLLMKRGCYVRAYHTGDPRWAEALRSWDPGLRAFRVPSREDMVAAREEGVQGFVYPEGCVDAVGRDPRPAYYPLLGVPESKRKALRQRVLGPATEG